MVVVISGILGSYPQDASNYGPSRGYLHESMSMTSAGGTPYSASLTYAATPALNPLHSKSCLLNLCWYEIKLMKKEFNCALVYTLIFVCRCLRSGTYRNLSCTCISFGICWPGRCSPCRLCQSCLSRKVGISQPVSSV